MAEATWNEWLASVVTKMKDRCKLLSASIESIVHLDATGVITVQLILVGNDNIWEELTATPIGPGKWALKSTAPTPLPAAKVVDDEALLMVVNHMCKSTADWDPRKIKGAAFFQ